MPPQLFKHSSQQVPQGGGDGYSLETRATPEPLHPTAARDPSGMLSRLSSICLLGLEDRSRRKVVSGNSRESLIFQVRLLEELNEKPPSPGKQAAKVTTDPTVPCFYESHGACLALLPLGLEALERVLHILKCKPLRRQRSYPGHTAKVQF